MNVKLTLSVLPITGKIKLVSKHWKELWKGYPQDLPEEYKNAVVNNMQAELENWNREILVIELDIE